jgi:hypothetical protein
MITRISLDMGGLAAGNAWLPARPDGSLWLGGGIVKPGLAGLPA